LGNVRLSYGRDPQARNEIKILEENHYYPYGLKHTNYNANLNAYKKDNNDQVQLTGTGLSADLINKYKFNGMEYQDELGLNLYDMDMRDYDPAIGRWTGIDPVTHFPQSPYNAFDGNPVTFADPSGADGIGGSTSYSSFGMTYESPNSSGMNNGYNIGSAFGAFHENVGAAWGDGGLLPNTMDILNTAYKISSSDATFVMGKNGWATYWNWENSYGAEMNALHINLKKYADKANYIIGSAASLVEKNAGISRLGNNVRFYEQTAKGGVFYGNQFVKTVGIAKASSALGIGFAGIAIASDIVGLNIWLNNPNSANAIPPGKFGLNIGISGIGLVNPFSGVLYGGIEAFYPGGLDGYGNNYNQIQRSNAAILGCSFVTAPYGALKQ
jgi:RHS repeat-associated protein